MRIRAQWAGACVTVHFSDAPALARLDGQAHVLSPKGVRAWAPDAGLAAPGRPLARARALLARAGRTMRRRWPGYWRVVARMVDRTSVDAYLRTVQGADLVLLTGAGALTDAFARHAVQLLETLEVGQAAGAVTAATGQGLGPLHEPLLVERAAGAVRGADLLALREPLLGVQLLAAWGVAPQQWTVTGDDALALLDAGLGPAAGPALGVCLRRAPYARIDDATLHETREVVRSFAAAVAAPVTGLPVSRHLLEDDADALGGLVQRDDGPRSPDALIERVRGCRTVLTGSYHAAVFALGSGVPVVALAGSPYYLHKFAGLAALFGDACQTVVPGPLLARDLRAALLEAWELAPPAREELCATARRQVVAGDAAYAEIFQLVEARVRPR
ncbi:polysaccharide pyruvyl transferase family protein [Nocardioides zhouii]